LTAMDGKAGLRQSAQYIEVPPRRLSLICDSLESSTSSGDCRASGVGECLLCG